MELKRNYPAVFDPLNINISTLGIREVSRITGIQVELIDKFVYLGLIDPIGKDPDRGEWIFSKDVIPLIQKIMRLHNDLEINFAGIGLVLELLSKIEALEARIKELESMLGLENY